MAHPRMQPMTEAEYLVWSREQDDRYEYVDGAPQLKFVEWDGAKMMTGPTLGHSAIAGNIFMFLSAALKGGPCRVFQSDGKIVTPRGNHRFADVTVDCGSFRPKEYDLTKPVAVFEVQSKSTHWIEVTRKIDEYRSVASIEHIVYLSQDEPRGRCWSRGDGWGVVDFEGLDAEIVLAALNITLPVRAVYEDAFAPDA